MRATLRVATLCACMALPLIACGGTDGAVADSALLAEYCGGSTGEPMGGASGEPVGGAANGGGANGGAGGTGSASNSAGADGAGEDQQALAAPGDSCTCRAVGQGAGQGASSTAGLASLGLVLLGAALSRRKLRPSG